ncbi:MAG: hypothetical protein QW207_03780, partial [Candidatus Micrarchaeaceae archaeon]
IPQGRHQKMDALAVKSEITGHGSTTFAPQDLGITINSDSVMLSFTLPKGSYASVFLGFVLRDNLQFNWV